MVCAALFQLAKRYRQVLRADLSQYPRKPDAERTDRTVAKTRRALFMRISIKKVGECVNTAH